MSFYSVHPWFVVLLPMLTAFPRFTMAALLICSDFASGGLLWWLGFFFMPRLLIAFLSLTYWATNPCLVILTWVICLSLEFAEKDQGRRKPKDEEVRLK